MPESARRDDLNDLMARAALREQAAFAMLYDVTSAKLFGVCLRVLQQRSDAEDALQETFAKIWRNASQFQATEQSPMSWLIAVARNCAIDRLRQRNPDSLPLDNANELPDSGPDPESAAAAGDLSRRLQECLSGLEPPRGAAIAAAYAEGYSYQELAGRYAIPLNTIRTWLRRGLLQLRECMGQ